jgi:hypothetical protein
MFPAAVNAVEMNFSRLVKKIGEIRPDLLSAQ